MPTVTEDYEELLSLLRTHLVQETKKGSWIFTTQESCRYFRQFAASKQQQKQVLQQIKNPIPQPAPIIRQQPEFVPKKIEPVVVPPVKIEEKVAPKIEPKESTAFKLEPLPVANPHEMSDIKKIIQEKFPNQVISDTVPEPAPPKVEGPPLPVETIILAFSNQPDEMTFLKNLAKAITATYGRAQVVAAENIEKQNAWEKLLQSPDIKMVIGQHDGFYSYPQLMQHHSCHQETSKHSLGDKALIMLSGIQSYLTMPQLKQALWKAIGQYHESKKGI